MLGERKLICMANTRKDSDRCVVGIDIETGNWLIPVNPNATVLTFNDIYYKNNEVPKIFRYYSNSVYCIIKV